MLFFFCFYLDAASQDAGGHLLVETGVLVTVGDHISQLTHQQQVGAVLVQSFDQCLLGAQTTHDHSVVFVQGSQTVQKADELLHNLWDRSKDVGIRNTVVFVCSKSGVH